MQSRIHWKLVSYDSVSAPFFSTNLPFLHPQVLAMGSIDAPDYGRRLLVQVVDDVARNDPTRELALFPRPGCSDRLASPESWQHVSFAQAARAIDRLAHAVTAAVGSGWVKPQVDLSGLIGPTLAYIGPSDLRYHLFLLAVSKAGGQVLLISPRNTVEGQVSLFASTGCRALWAPATSRSLVESWPAQTPGGLALFTMPELDALLADDDDAAAQGAGFSRDPFPFHRTFDEAATEALVILHTSGTTGLPKPIVIRHGMWANFDTFQGVADESGPTLIWYAWKKHITHLFVTLPPFHTGGMSFSLVMSIYLGITVILPPTDRPVSSILVEDVLTHSAADGAIIPPFTLEELAKTASGDAALQKTKFIICGGGALSKAVGDHLVAKGITISNIISSTEALPYALQFQDNMSEWEYFIMRDEIMGSDWRPIAGSDNIYELVLVRQTPRQKTPGMHVAFWTFPELDEWSTRDLYQRHPTKPDHWKYHGRIDSIIVFSNGEKLNPEDIEKTVLGHPSVHGAVVVGAGRFQAALLIEPKAAALAGQTGPDAAERLIEDVWPYVEAANKLTVSHGRIARPFIILADPAKPFPRAGKGTIQRQKAVKLYEHEIDELYRRVGSNSNATENHAGPAPVVLDTSSKAALAKSIRTVFIDRLGASPHLEVDTDFFTVGAIDSLQVMSAIRLLKDGLAAQSSTENASVTQRAIYGNPTPTKLAAYILSMVSGGKESATADDDDEIGRMEVLIDRYTANLKAPSASRRPAPRTTGQTILVTGTTGSLGSYMLDSLLNKNAAVQKVIALTRDADGGKVRQERVFRSKGLDTAGLSDPSRVQFLHATLSEPRLGLSDADYDGLLADVDRIVHCAWPVNFSYNVASFEPSIAGVRHLADLAAAAKRQAPLLFVSSIGMVDSWGRTSSGAVPEERLEDLRLAGMGYGRSKLVSCLILDAVAAATDVPVLQVRLGQVGGPREAGDSEAAWNRQELVPSVIASSVFLGVLPDSLGVLAVDWVPSEDAAEVIIELVAGDNLQGSHYYNLVNPTVRTWASIVPHIQQFYGDRIKEVVSLKDWVTRLEESSRRNNSSTPEAVAANPAVKLVDRLQAMVTAAEAGWKQATFALEQTSERSATMRNMEPVTGELVAEWCRQWSNRAVTVIRGWEGQAVVRLQRGMQAKTGGRSAVGYQDKPGSRPSGRATGQAQDSFGSVRPPRWRAYSPLAAKAALQPVMGHVDRNTSWRGSRRKAEGQAQKQGRDGKRVWQPASDRVQRASGMLSSFCPHRRGLGSRDCSTGVQPEV
ncbi:nonribosomal peptide synthetase [Grosmannia clavigera kw1407]|uniref:Nonribosomal peptide synthetase n=1 Tax=Grosmannia clavigera (strain kw1407 / UAMH 11150) TaxID=655863 RepID=F0XEK1_GROCL|nr:nonribosomal peptide synthetase [Grosmannia clavigera kw1407]EFX04332.1 nonribosomal peptide synthetase [Grosmannia clavigera kw1407]